MLTFFVGGSLKYLKKIQLQAIITVSSLAIVVFVPLADIKNTAELIFMECQPYCENLFYIWLTKIFTSFSGEVRNPSQFPGSFSSSSPSPLTLHHFTMKLLALTQAL